MPLNGLRRGRGGRGQSGWRACGGISGDGYGVDPASQAVVARYAPRRDHEDGVGGFGGGQHGGQQCMGPGKPCIFPAEPVRHLLGLFGITLFLLSAAGINKGGPSVVSRPALHKIADVVGIVAAVCLCELFVGLVEGMCRTVGAHVLARGAVSFFLHPTGGEIEGAGVGRELLAVFGIRTEKQRNAVVNAGNDERNASSLQPNRSASANPVADDDAGGLLHFADAINGLLEFKSQPVRCGMQSAGQKVEPDVESCFRGNGFQVDSEYAAGNDIESG